MVNSIAFLAAYDGSPRTDWHEQLFDFDFYLATDWVITETGSGTRAISQAVNGILVVTNAGADNDVNSLQARDVASGQVAEHWKWISGKRLYFGIRFKISDATQSDLFVGLHITTTTPATTPPVDGIYFRKDDGDTHIDLIVRKDDVETLSLTNVAQMVSDTYTVLEFYYDGKTLANGGAIQFYKDGVPIGSVPLTNVPDDEELAISFAHQNGEAAAKALSLDWIRVIEER